MAASKDTKKPYYEQISERLIKQLEEGTAPWQKPWEPGTQRLPHNPISGARYKGANALWLSMQGRSDPRWMTYKQAQSVNAQVTKGEKGTPVQYWKFRDQLPKRDENGKPVLDDKGKKVMVSVELEKPKVFSAVVFNAEQIKGLPPLEAKKEPSWDRHERAEAILKASGAALHHDQDDSAFYRPSTDTIHMPDKGQFPSADRYYATALHELGHWTGHSSRLDRDLSSNPLRSREGYAKEELRAEIASMAVGEELEIGHDPGQHAAYVKSWVRVLKDDPKEILRAARDAEKIRDVVMGYEPNYDQHKEQGPKATITPAAAGMLHKLDQEAVEGYSPLESWKMMQAEAAQQGYTARIDLNEDQNESSQFVINYDDRNGNATGIRTDMYSDSKMESSINGRRLSIHISNDSESQPRYLRDAIKEHETGNLHRHSSSLREAPQKPQDNESNQDQGESSALSLKIAEKVAQNFTREEDRARFLERVQDRLKQGANHHSDIRIKESYSAQSDSDMER